MMTLLSRAPARMRINFILVLLFFGVMLFFGGASRPDVLSLPLVRLTAIVMAAIALMQIDRAQWRAVRLPVYFILAVAAIIAVQLIPLPPELWASLPGHNFYRDPLQAAGLADVWRPLSLTPDLTLNALLAVLPPLAAILALGTIDRALHVAFVPLLLAAIGASAVVGLLQIASGSGYFYTITNEGAAVGFFSNRNHLGVLLAIGFPVLACWAAMPHEDPAFRNVRRWLALCAGAAIFPLLLATGSRAGLVLGIVGALLAFGIRVRRRRSPEDGRGRPKFRLVTLLPVAVGAVAIVATIWLSRDLALSRLLEGAEDQRSAFLPIYLTMAKDYFPFGAGFGSFDAVFRSYEPLQTMGVEYLNHAHNDVIQVVIEGGLAAALAVVAFLLWFVVRAWPLWRHPVRSPGELLGRTGSAVTLLILLSSFVDYPLRTPWMAVLLAVSCCWMLPRRGSGGEEREKGLAVQTG